MGEKHVSPGFIGLCLDNLLLDLDCLVLVSILVPVWRRMSVWVESAVHVSLIVLAFFVKLGV